MLLKICDIFTSFCQSLLFVWITNNIASRGNKLSKIKFYILISIVFVDTIIFTYSGITMPSANFLMVLVALSIIMIFYRKVILDAFLGFGLAYSIIVVTAYFVSTFYKYVLHELNLSIPSEVQMLLFIYIPIWLVFALVYIFRKLMFDTCLAVKNLKRSLVLILLIDYALIFLDTLHMEWATESMGVIFKFILNLTAFTVFVFAAIYFAKINDKSKEVEMLNIALNEKVTELKKIKHDYGSEISSLYGLYQLGKIDRIGSLLKGIVERYQGMNPTINISVQATPLVASVLNYAFSAGVNVIVFDGGNYESLAVTDNDLLKLLSNIVRNSVDALERTQNPTIKFKSYNSYKGIVISVINNGPQISEDSKGKIFRAGFSTKENKSSDRGYGLSIVMDIIKGCNGEISVESSKEWTQFKIEIPYQPNRILNSKVITKGADV
jgi:two-component system, LytTR family, sensor histidine kinase AgrC